VLADVNKIAPDPIGTLDLGKLFGINPAPASNDCEFSDRLKKFEAFVKNRERLLKQKDAFLSGDIARRECLLKKRERRVMEREIELTQREAALAQSRKEFELCCNSFLVDNMTCDFIKKYFE